jgi:hypothetical protein
LHTHEARPPSTLDLDLDLALDLALERIAALLGVPGR